MVPKERRQPGDAPFIIDDSPINGGGFGSGYYIHRVEHPNAPQLTQIQYYIVMKGNVKLYKRLVEEVRLGSKVLGSDYDAVTTEEYPKAPIVGGKVFHLKGHQRKGLRTVHNDVKEEIVPLVFKRSKEDDEKGRKPEDILRSRMGKWFLNKPGGYTPEAGDTEPLLRSGDQTGGTPTVQVHHTSKERNRGDMDGINGQEEIKPATRRVVDCPKCGNHEHVIRNAMQGTYYCTLHPRAIMEELLA